MTEARRELFKRIIWDYTYTPEEVEAIIQNEGMANEKVMMYRKILMSERWYNIMRILTPTELQQALQEEVIKTIWIKYLQEKYRNVRRLLFEGGVLKAA
ncbi:MAG: hypothetical protein EAZ32_18670 [Cytophagia bacterium]|nr:MAG: hypothetical protein EAZ46_12705 [Runella sp.]TAG24354.1 MAG: hypothetical protein EAZ38_01315 [Cytophagales bacterium]TAG35191.1 MAG: hypothetical protein EAZ32_18670 [Cytophagia bacterium]TAG51337.1 MAG: hypothetical protein EAZ29_09920 [Runella slithyformis]TAG77123.1 MAG: hypothetical protein EAZ22_16345 [Cytophagales bacterium]